MLMLQLYEEDPKKKNDIVKQNLYSSKLDFHGTKPSVLPCDSFPGKPVNRFPCLAGAV